MIEFKTSKIGSEDRIPNSEDRIHRKPEDRIPNSEDQIHRKPEDQKNDHRTESAKNYKTKKMYSTALNSIFLPIFI